MIEGARKAIPPNISRKLWVKSGGRCQYEGCNTSLWKDSLSQLDMNKAYIAHIVGAKEKASRGDSVKSKELEIDYANLMLLCDECHNRIDKSQPKEHTVEILQKMKKDHEERIEILTGIKVDKKSHILIYTAKIGDHQVSITYKEAAATMIPNNFPVDDKPLQLGLSNSIAEDCGEDYWTLQKQQLEKSFFRNVEPLKGNHPIQHFSLFAFAPQPLLIRLGTLLSDKYHTEIYQLHRSPRTWNWQQDATIKEFTFTEPSDKSGIPVLVFSLSGTIDKKNIIAVLGENCSIWEITILKPDYNFLRTKELLVKFVETTRHAFNVIKTVNNHFTFLNIFPAMPVSAAIETGRLWMPKADMPLRIFDFNSKNNGFSSAIEISNI